METYPTLQFELGETVNLLRESVRDFVKDNIAHQAAEIDSNNLFPHDLWEKMGAMGLLGITVEEQYGGAGMGYLEHVVASSMGVLHSLHGRSESRHIFSRVVKVCPNSISGPPRPWSAENVGV